MAWIGLIVGILLGGAIGRWPGALACGFLGWLVGFIIAAQKKPRDRTPVIPSQAGIHRPERSVADRLDAIERRLAAIERSISATSDQAPETDLSAMLPNIPAEAPAVTPAQAQAVTPAEAGAQGPERSAQVEPEPVAPLGSLDSRLRGNDKAPNPIVAWFFGGNTIVRVGLLVLFLGLGFLVKYGVEHQLIPVELRVAAVGAAGLALLIVGWRLRLKREGYALSLQGAGVAVLYLTIFGAMKLYGLVPPPLAFTLLVAIAALSAFLAVRQDSLVFAVFAAAGGFLAPVLASTGQGSHVMLFSYYLLLNASIVAIAWFKAWRLLNLVGFLFTALIGLAWGVRSYNDDLFATTEPFLIAFFLVYVAIAILFARTESKASSRYVDGSIVFGTPIFAFGMQAGLMRGTEFGLAFSAVAASVIYLAAAWLLSRRESTRYRMLVESFLALGVVFATLAIPLALDARWTSAAWALEGCAIVWVGLRQQRRLARFFGYLLQLLAGASFVLAIPLPGGPPFANATFVGALILSLTGFVTCRLLARPAADTASEKLLAPMFFLWGLAWLLLGGGHEIETYVPLVKRPAVWVAFVSGIALVFGWIPAYAGMTGSAGMTTWREARWPGYALGPVLLAFATWDMVWRRHPFRDSGWAWWIFAIAVLFALLKRNGPEAKSPLAPILHVLAVALVALVGALEIEWFAGVYTDYGTAWALASRIVAPSLVLMLISSRAMDYRWPVSEHTAAYRIGAATLLTVAMGVWSLHVNWAHAGGSEPLPYLPLLNALDLAHVFAGLAVLSAVFAARRSGLKRPEFLTPAVAATAGGAIAFIWANSMLLRTIHHWAGVTYAFNPLWRSVLVQASLSVFWSFLALALMIYATRKKMRALWLVGAALMGVVLAKLVLIDFSHLAGIERIVSFIGVGILMLVIGYFSPVPPRKVEAA